MQERKVTVNPRASSIVITKDPRHVTINRSGIEKLKDEVGYKYELIHFSKKQQN